MVRSASITRLASLSWEDCRLLVESVTDYAIYMLDQDGRVTTWNLGAERIKGYTAEEIVGQHFSRFFTPEDLAADKPARELLAAREFGRAEDEGYRVRKDGTRFWANVVITALCDPSGRLRGFAKVTRDVTARHEAEQRLRESEQRFHHLVDAVTDYVICMLDPTGVVTTWNEGARRTQGYEADEIIGRHFSTFYTPEDLAAGKPEAILESVRRHGRHEDEGHRVRKDGTRFWANVVLTSLRDERGELIGFAKVMRDLTTRRQAQETEQALAIERAARTAAEQSELELKAAAQRAEEANRVKDEFLATISHELRTPLNAILGWSSLLRQRPLEPSLARAIDVIHRNAQAQARIVDDVLEVSRMITGKLRLSLELTDLAALVSDTIEVVRPSAEAKGVAVEFRSAGEPALLVADPERLRQVAWNLLSNAVKFTERSGAVTVWIEHQGSGITLWVRDTGHGIDREFLPHLFERFRQADGSSTRRFGGLGLGLSIVRHIVELHGGQVHAESGGKGLGALFGARFPVRASVESPREPGAGAKPSAARVTSLSGVRVLVVEDDADSRALLADVLLEAGAMVEAVESAASGLAAVVRFRPHVVVSDIGMPEEDGYGFVRKLRELDPASGGGVPSLALTAYTKPADRNRALAAGFTTHIGKPVKADDLVAAIANLVALAQG